MNPTTSGPYLYTPHFPDARPALVEVVLDEGTLKARLPDGDDGFDLQPVDDMSGVWQAAPQASASAQEASGPSGEHAGAATAWEVGHILAQMPDSVFEGVRDERPHEERPGLVDEERV